MKKIIDTTLEVLLILVLGSMIVTVTWQVLSRYVAGSPSTFTDEISGFLLIWLGLFGAAYATGKELHLAIDLIPLKTIQKSPYFFTGFVSVSVLTFAILVMLVGGSYLCYLTFILKQNSAVLEIPLYYVYSALPLSSLFIVYYTVAAYIKKIKIIKNTVYGLYGGTGTGN